jgi:hypothetical protein
MGTASGHTRKHETRTDQCAAGTHRPRLRGPQDPPPRRRGHRQRPRLLRRPGRPGKVGRPGALWSRPRRRCRRPGSGGRGRRGVSVGVGGAWAGGGDGGCGGGGDGHPGGDEPVRRLRLCSLPVTSTHTSF